MAGIDGVALRRLLRRQKGIITSEQAVAVGISRPALTRRTRGPAATWQRVLPHVYAAFTHELSPWQWTMAALLYAGPSAVVTGLTALRLYGVRYLPFDPMVHVLVPAPAARRTFGRVCIEETTRPPASRSLDGLRAAMPARAAADAARRLKRSDDVLAVVTGVVQRELALLDELRAELAAGATRGSARLRRALWAVSDGARSVAEARLLRLIASAGLPQPTAVNSGVVLPGHEVRCPDIRWGRLIVELDSREWHLLVPGSWEATHRRRKSLERAGYVVLVITTEELRRDPQQVVADIRARLAALGMCAP